MQDCSTVSDVLGVTDAGESFGTLAGGAILNWALPTAVDNEDWDSPGGQALRVVPTTAGGQRSAMITGSSYQPSINGLFTPSGQTQHGMDVYTNSDSSRFL